MIVTDKFVWLAHGKTGSTSAEIFCSRVWMHGKVNQPILFRAIEKIAVTTGLRHQAYRQILTPSKYPGGVPHKHGTIRDIPDYAATLPIVSCFREPFGYFLSHYNYGAWRRQNRLAFTTDAKYAESLMSENSIESFIEYLNLQAKHHLNNAGIPADIGMLTIDIVEQFSLNPGELLENLSQRHIPLSEAFPAVTWLSTENLISDLKKFLESVSFCVDSLQKVTPKIHENSSRTTDLSETDKQLITQYLMDKEKTLLTWSDEISCLSSIHKQEF